MMNAVDKYSTDIILLNRKKVTFGKMLWSE